MRKLSMLILDEAIEVAAGFTDAITSESLSEPLGRYDRLAFEVVAEDARAARAAPTIELALETSCDGIHWVEKSQSLPFTLDLAAATVFWFADDRALPSYALVRVRARLSCKQAARARVRIFATARDSGAHELQGSVPTDAYGWQPSAFQEPAPKRSYGELCSS